MERDAYRLPELADAAGVTPRTVRYYIAQGLLPSPGRLGAGTRYGSEHLDRLHLIRRLQDQGLSLAEIRDRLQPGTARVLADASQTPLEPPMGMLRGLQARPAAPLPEPADGTVWERIALAPDVELHVRRPHGAGTGRLVRELVRFVEQRRGD